MIVDISNISRGKSTFTNPVPPTLTPKVQPKKTPTKKEAPVKKEKKTEPTPKPTPKKKSSKKEEEIIVEYSPMSYMDYSVQLKDGVDVDSRTIYLSGEIDDQEHIRFLQKVNTILTLTTNPEEAKKPINLVINSPGGVVYSAFAMIDLMTELKKRGILVNTHAYGFAASCGLLLLLAGTGVRMCNKNCVLLAHEFQHSMYSVNTSQLKLDIEKSDIMVEEYVSILKKNSNKPAKWWRKKLAYKDLWITPEKAYEIGIIDEIFASDHPLFQADIEGEQ